MKLSVHQSVGTLSSSERFALTSGAISVLLTIGAGVHLAVAVLSKMPPIDAPSAQVANYFAEHAALVTFANYLFTPQAPFFLFFLGGMYSILSRAEGESRVFTTAAMAAGIVMVAPWFYNIVLETSSYGIARAGGDAATVSAFNGLGPNLYALGGFTRAVLLISISSVLLNSQLGPRWVAWLGYAAAAAGLVGTGTFLTPDMFPLTLLGLLLFGVWMVTVSVTLQRGAQAARSQLPEAASA